MMAATSTSHITPRRAKRIIMPVLLWSFLFISAKLRKFGQYSKYLFQNLTGENKGDMLSEYVGGHEPVGFSGISPWYSHYRLTLSFTFS
jgi:hypothetical protein